MAANRGALATGYLVEQEQTTIGTASAQRGRNIELLKRTANKAIICRDGVGTWLTALFIDLTEGLSSHVFNRTQQS